MVEAGGPHQRGGAGGQGGVVVHSGGLWWSLPGAAVVGAHLFTTVPLLQRQIKLKSVGADGFASVNESRIFF